MARLDREDAPQGPLVQGFAPGGFSIDGEVYRAAFLTPTGAAEWTAPALGELSAESLEQVLGIDPVPEFLILGTGPTIAFPPRALIRAIEAKGIGVEVMDSRAAARTWGLLRHEERWIVAALMPLG
jgi:uncharacterized protein